MRRLSMWLVGLTLVLLLGSQAMSSALPATAAGWTAYVGNLGSDSASTPGTVASLNTATDAVSESGISVGNDPGQEAITPNGQTLYVANGLSGSVTPISTATGTAGTPIAFPRNDEPMALAISPDGQTAYVTTNLGQIQPINIANNTLGTAFSDGANYPFAIAITPNGQTAYVADHFAGTVVPVTLASHTVGPAITIDPAMAPGSQEPSALAITPNGQTVYVANADANTVVPINTATNTAGAPIPVGTEPAGLAITPNGQTLYVADINSANVTPISTATNTAGAAISLPGTDPAQIAITPDGQTAYVTSEMTNGTVTPISTATNTPGAAIPVGDTSYGIAITPDQAPTAAFSVTPGPGGTAVSFDGSASSSPVGSIVSYLWDFGDGESATTATAATTHVYAKAGTYVAKLTVTNSAGTSTTQVFTGQTVSNDGGPSATTTEPVTVAAPPVTTTPGTTTTPTAPAVGGVSTTGDSIVVTVRVVGTGEVVVTVTITTPTGTTIIVYINPARAHGSLLWPERTSARAATRQLVIGTSSVFMKAGATRKIAIKLNAAGRALLAGDQHLTAALTVKQSGILLKRLTVHLRAPKTKAIEHPGLGELAQLTLYE